MARWTLRKQFRFEASHRLVQHDGKCARLHGHSWIGYIETEGTGLIKEGPKKNMLVDYGDMAKELAPIIALLDHSHLNDVLGTDAPTSEYVAAWIHRQLADLGIQVSRVTIEETCTSRCVYEP